MKYQEQYIAEDLYKSLQSHFKTQIIEILVHGVGVHWSCSAILNKRECKIHCFEYRYYEIIKPEYLMEFKENQVNCAWGRTQDKNLAISSCDYWIANNSIELLYKQYEFVDQQKRAIQSLELEIKKNQTELVNAKFSMNSPWGSGIYAFSISYHDRSCELITTNKSELTKFKFCWDACPLFEVGHKDIIKLSLAIKRWLVDYAKPSDLEIEFDWINIGELAEYYERGDGITGEFIQSWNAIEEFYKEIDEPFVEKVLQMIADMRKKGFDKTIRAGQSLYLLVLSRSRRHGLRNGQHSFTFGFPDNSMEIRNEKGEIWKFDKVELNEKLELMLRELERKEIN